MSFRKRDVCLKGKGRKGVGTAKGCAPPGPAPAPRPLMTARASRREWILPLLRPGVGGRRQAARGAGGPAKAGQTRGGGGWEAEPRLGRGRLGGALDVPAGRRRRERAGC